MNSISLRLLILLLAAFLATAAETYKYSYDEMGRLVKAESSGGLVISYTYDASGNLLRREIVAPAKANAATGRKKAAQTKTAASKGAQ